MVRRTTIRKRDRKDFRETLWELGIRKVHNIAQFLLGDGGSLRETAFPGR
jgi:hypothetical protein